MYRTARGEAPVEVFLRELPAKHQARIARVLELLVAEGPQLRRPYADHVRGRIRELRVAFSRLEYRILHCVWGRQVILLHAFIKKTPAVPEREIRTAEYRLGELEGTSA